MRWPISISLFLVVAGLSLVAYAMTLPVYTDEKAPARISDALYPEVDAKGKVPDTGPLFKEWFRQLRAFETPHKRLSDFGRGLCAAGVGLLLANAFWIQYHRSPKMRTAGVIFSIWVLLWAARIPFSIWYYGLREERFDYPTWGDSVAIPIFSNAITCVVGAIVTALFLKGFLFQHPLPAKIGFHRPEGAYGWFRAGILFTWIVILGLVVASGIPNGDAGAVLTCTVASVILTAFLAATKVHASAAVT